MLPRLDGAPTTIHGGFMHRRLLAVPVLLACSVALTLVAQAQGPGGMPPGGPGGPPPGGMRPGMMPFPPDSFAAERDSLMKLTLERYAGKENMPAESVFKHIEIMKGRTVLQVLRGMNGMGRSLGVPCSHCHVENHWADEDKKPKAIARNMLRMTSAINDSLLTRFQWPDDDKPHVGCFTCHHGQPKPGGMGGERRGPGGPGGPGGMGRPDGDRH
jgi:hypothetical protein